MMTYGISATQFFGENFDGELQSMRPCLDRIWKKNKTDDIELYIISTTCSSTDVDLDDSYLID